MFFFFFNFLTLPLVILLHAGPLTPTCSRIYFMTRAGKKKRRKRLFLSHSHAHTHTHSRTHTPWKVAFLFFYLCEFLQAAWSERTTPFFSSSSLSSFPAQTDQKKKKTGCSSDKLCVFNVCKKKRKKERKKIRSWLWSRDRQMTSQMLLPCRCFKNRNIILNSFLKHQLPLRNLPFLLLLLFFFPHILIWVASSRL